MGQIGQGVTQPPLASWIGNSAGRDGPSLGPTAAVGREVSGNLGPRNGCAEKGGGPAMSDLPVICEVVTS